MGTKLDREKREDGEEN